MSKMKNAMRMQRREGFVPASSQERPSRGSFGGCSVGQVRMACEFQAEGPRGTEMPRKQLCLESRS